MERIAIAGISLRATDVAGLERAKSAVRDEEIFARDLADLLGASEMAVISTCNRVEIVFAREEGHFPCERDRDVIAAALALDRASEDLHFESGIPAARRLFRVACSLDSLVLGEAQILAQVREAFARAEARGWTGRLLAPLFHHALQIGKHVRTRTSLSRHPVSVVSLGVEALREHCARSGAVREVHSTAARGDSAGAGFAASAREQRESDPGEYAGVRLALIGAGQMGRLFAANVREAGFTIAHVVNRTLAPAATLAHEFGARAWTLDDFRRERPPIDALASATSSPAHVLSARELATLASRSPNGCLFALDLAVPRDLEPTSDSAVEIVDLEALRSLSNQNRALRAQAALEAEAMIEQKLTAFAHHAFDRRSAALLAEVHESTREIVERELAQLSSGRLGTLSDDQRRAVERWARAAFGRLEHAPLSALKRLREEQSATEETPE